MCNIVREFGKNWSARSNSIWCIESFSMNDRSEMEEVIETQESVVTESSTDQAILA